MRAFVEDQKSFGRLEDLAVPVIHINNDGSEAEMLANGLPVAGKISAEGQLCGQSSTTDLISEPAPKSCSQRKRLPSLSQTEPFSTSLSD